MTKKVLLPAMMINWLDTLLDYQFDIFHCPGMKSVSPHHLSWLFPPIVTTDSTTLHSSLLPQIGTVMDKDTLCVSYVNVDPIDAPLKLIPLEERAALMNASHN